MQPTEICSHYNQYGEKISIDLVHVGMAAGKYVLSVHDDPPPIGTGTKAPTLLDPETVNWLLAKLTRLKLTGVPV